MLILSLEDFILKKTFCHELVGVWLIKRYGFWIGHWICLTHCLQFLVNNLQPNYFSQSQLCSHQFTFIVYNTVTVSHTACLQFTHTHSHSHESSQSAVPHQFSCTSFQWQTYLFMGSRTVPAPQPQQLVTHNAVTNFIMPASLNSSGAVHLPTSNFSCSFPNSLLQVTCNRARTWVVLMLWLMLNRPIWLGVGTPLGLMTRFFFFRTIALPLILERPLWREDGSLICSAICQWSESLRTHNCILLSHLRLLSTTHRDYGGRILTHLYMGLELRLDITSFRNVAVWNLRSCFCGVPSLRRTGLEFAV
jgi:hypothetical protein